MLNRCRNKNLKCYPMYGGRGITVSESWLTFENFYDDMGDPPTDRHSIDRINNDLGYSKENCRWATPREQAGNKSNSLLIECNGVVACAAEWERRMGFVKGTINRRISRGMDPAEAATRPIEKKYSCSR